MKNRMIGQLQFAVTIVQLGRITQTLVGDPDFNWHEQLNLMNIPTRVFIIESFEFLSEFGLTV